jgi:hypothetical protein
MRQIVRDTRDRAGRVASGEVTLSLLCTTRRLLDELKFHARGHQIGRRGARDHSAVVQQILALKQRDRVRRPLQSSRHLIAGAVLASTSDSRGRVSRDYRP